MLEDEMLTIDDLAAYLKLKPQTIYRWAQTGKIPGAKFGKEWRFRRSAIERWIESSLPSDQGRRAAGDTGKARGKDGSAALVAPKQKRKGAGPPARAKKRVKKLRGPEAN